MLGLLEIGPNGKPHHPQLPHFNISNSATRVAVLIGDDAVGCDIELLRPRPRFMGVARHSFSPELYHWLESQPVDEQLCAFWRLWTAHEAVVKQQGERYGKWPRFNYRSRVFARRTAIFVILPLRILWSPVAAHTLLLRLFHQNSW